tara:strand:+ start:198 stop:911 length:714 start_codon:yes stop_codon:yes gene_type:complete
MLSDTTDSNDINIEQLLEEFSRSSTRKRRNLIKQIENKSLELIKLEEKLLNDFDPAGDDWAAGWILQVCQRHHPDFLAKFSEIFVNWFATHSSVGIDYSSLQQNLLEEKYEEADRITSSILRELAGPSAVDRGYVYYSEVSEISGLDLVTMDRLWIAYSQGRFGFSIQGALLDVLNGSYEKLWPRIGWKKNGVWTRYPKSFTWEISAPEGHMPLVNQLRGVRLIDALLSHSSLKPRR